MGKIVEKWDTVDNAGVSAMTVSLEIFGLWGRAENGLLDAHDDAFTDALVGQRG